MSCIDAIMIIGSNYDHMTANVKACEEGPLEQSEYRGAGGDEGDN